MVGEARVQQETERQRAIHEMNSLQDLALELTKHAVYCVLDANVRSVVR